MTSSGPRRFPPLVVISGPSGGGKTTIARALMRTHPHLLFSVSATTRPRRATEVDGQDYYFIPRAEFERRIRNNELIEWQQIYGDYYGSLKSEVDRALTTKTPMLFDIDVKGALSIRQQYPEHALLIFVRPPTTEILTERLRNRRTETAETFARRMERVTMELGLAPQFDHCIINDHLDEAISTAQAIVHDALQERV